jgi:bla regulator protein blaR1
MNFIQGILPDRIIDTIGWTILHSLWQGLIIGILLFLLLYFYRNHNAEIRYNLSVFSLILFFGISVLTFIFYFKDAIRTDGITEHGILIPDNRNGSFFSETHSVATDSAVMGSIQSLTDAISSKFPFIITLYLVGVFIISARMTGGIFMTQRLRKSCLYEIPEELQKKFLHLISIMNIHKSVSINGSSLISVPSVVGYLKPVILIPFTALTHIPVDQLEAIIAHELAHIRRHDYLVNLFQLFMEALFFYHPVMWIIQKRIRKERENCCDDLALSYSQGQINYIKALTSIQEIPSQSGFPLLALGSDKHHLLIRIVRILKKEKMKTNFRDKLLAGFILTSAIVIILLNTGGKFISFNSKPGDVPLTDQIGEATLKPMTAGLVEQVPLIIKRDELSTTEPVKTIEPASVTPPLPVIPRDTSLKVKDNVIQRTFLKNGKETDLKMKIEQGEIKELSINGEKIPETEYGNYQAEIDETLEDVKNLERDLSEANQQLNQVNAEEIERELEENMREIEEQIREIDVEAMVENIEIPEIDKEKMRQEIEHAIQEIETIDMEKIREEMEFAMQSACEEMEKIEIPEMNELKMEMNKALQELKEIDQEKIQKEIQEAMEDIQIDKEALKREIEKSVQEMKEIDTKEIRKNIEDDRTKMEEMLREIEKLELEDK